MLDRDPNFGRIGQRCGVDGPDIGLLAVVLKNVRQIAVFEAFAYVPLLTQQDPTIVDPPLMLEFLGKGEARYQAGHDAILCAIEDVIATGPKTPDLGGTASTQDVGKAIAAALGT